MLPKYHKSYQSNEIVGRKNIYEIIVGAMMSMFWPVFLSLNMLSPWYGWMGMVFGLVISGLLIVYFLYYFPFIFLRIARGSWIFGLLCGFPIIPLILGLLIFEFVNMFNPITGSINEVNESINKNLNFYSSFFMTIIYSWSSIIISILFGALVNVAIFLLKPTVSPTS